MKPFTLHPTALLLLSLTSIAHADDLSARLKNLDSRAIPKEDAAFLDEMLSRSIRAGVHAAHREHADPFDKVRTLDDWKR